MEQLTRLIDAFKKRKEQEMEAMSGKEKGKKLGWREFVAATGMKVKRAFRKKETEE